MGGTREAGGTPERFILQVTSSWLSTHRCLGTDPAIGKEAYIVAERVEWVGVGGWVVVVVVVGCPHVGGKRLPVVHGCSK